MAKKRKQEEQGEEKTIDDALEAAKLASSSLQGLLTKITEGPGFFKRKQEDDQETLPQLSYEKKEIVEQYLMEDVPISQRPSVKARPSFADKVPITEKAPAIPPPRPPPGPPPGAPVTQVPKSDRIMIYSKLGEFFEEYLKSYNERYTRWEDSISNILAVLRKMRKITKKNTEDLVSTVGGVYGKIEEHLNQFKVKRDQIERISGVDIESMSVEFKRVLGLLECQVKEYQLKRIVDDYIRQQTMFS